jgi:hypothetical protein
VLTGNQLRQELHRWLAPPDPSTNHNIACNAHHKGTATWFFEGSTYKNWKSTGSESLLWIHGKRALLLFHSAARRHLIKILICSWLRQEHTLVRRAFAFSCQRQLSHLSFPAPQSSKISRPCAMMAKLRWPTSISISETSINNTGVTYSPPFLSNSLHNPVLVVTFYHVFIPITTVARDSLMTSF